MKHKKLRFTISWLTIVMLLSSLAIFSIGCDKPKDTNVNKQKTVTAVPKPEVSQETEKKQSVTSQEALLEAPQQIGEPKKTALTAPAATTAKTEQVAVSAVGEGKLLFSINDLAITQGESVYSVTKRAAAQAGTALDATGLGPTVYVTGIGSLREFDQGPMSGWLYRVNGKTPGVGCGSYKLKSGDKVEWVFTTDGKIAE